jgi:hypothetical protein
VLFLDFWMLLWSAAFACLAWDFLEVEDQIDEMQLKQKS